jgi:hypothetical protein
MNQEITVGWEREGTRSEIETGQRAIAGDASRNDGTESSRRGFNRYIYENLLCNVEGQIETWNRMPVREANPEAAQVLWLKAQGLGYALRLLYAFKPEFEELVAIAGRTNCIGCGAELENHPYLPATDSDLCDSCYEIAHPLPERSAR